MINENECVYEDEVSGTQYFIFSEDSFFGICNSNREVVIPAHYLDIFCFGVINSDKAGWGRRPYKHFLALQNQDKIWRVYAIKTSCFLDKRFEYMRKINTTPYFMDQNKDFWVVSYYTEDFEYAKPNPIQEGFVHKELNSKTDVYFKPYILRFYERHLKNFSADENDIATVQRTCLGQVLNTDYVFDTLYDLYTNDQYDEAIILCRYLIYLYDLSPQLSKSEKSTRAEVYSLWLECHYYLDEFEKGLAIYKKLQPMLRLLKEGLQIRTYSILFACLDALNLPKDENIKHISTQIYEGLTKKEQAKYASAYQDILR